MLSTNSFILARVAAGLYDVWLGNETMDWALEQANFGTGINGLVQSVYDADFAGMSDAAVASMLVANLGINADNGVSAATISIVETIVADALAAAPGAEGATIVNLVNIFANATSHPELGAAATAFNANMMAAVNYAELDDTLTIPRNPPEDALDFTIARQDAAGLSVMRLLGDTDVRIDFTNPAHQVTGLDFDQDGTIELNGTERNVAWLESNVATIGANHSNFEAVDAYPRNPLDHTDSTANFLGDIWFDGEGFDGDGVSTNGNIFLGGLGTDTALGGNGNDFLAGGGIAQGRVGADTLYGGRNADFFFAQFAGIDLRDGGISLRIDGGNTADDNSAANSESSQDSDWLLLEATDDQEPVTVILGEDPGVPFDAPVEVFARTGESMHLEDVENLDASGNLYGFLDDFDTQLGDRAADDRDGDVGYNYAYGSSAQLDVSGSNVANIIIGGYDNDVIRGNGGDDLLFGGNLHFRNNPNLAGIWNDGRDELIGGAGEDNIVFETDGGVYEGGATVAVDDGEDDTLWLTDLTFGTRTVSDVTSDGVVRIDLAAGKVGGTANSAGYGGADRTAATGSYTSDQTNYNSGYARAQVQDFEGVIATGLGGVDYLAAGSNDPEYVFTNQQNHYWFAGDLDLRGNWGLVNTLYASVGDDTLEGRTGGTSTFNASATMTSDDRDKLSGGAGSDDFIFDIAGGADGVDVIHRQTNLDVDGDGVADNLTDGTFGVDFGEEGPQITSNSTLTLSLPTGATVNVAGVSFLLNGTVYTLSNLASATYAAFTTALNAALDAVPALAGLNAVLNADNTVTITDPAGGTFAKNDAGGWIVTGSLPPDGTSSWLQIVGDPQTSQDQDRIIYTSYEDRLDGERTDDQSTTGSSISLGVDAYAEDLVMDFKVGANGLVSTSLAEDQVYRLTFSNLTTEDWVTISVNGVDYKLQVGVDLDGNEIANEELAGAGGTAASQAVIQTNFLNRMIGFINTFMDDDTASGELTAGTFDGGATTISLIQADYNGEETVFMRTPVVTLGNGSGGQPASVSVRNESNHEVELFEFDGRGGELNRTNVLFWGDQEISRSILETGAGAAGTANTMAGSDAMIIDGGANTLQSVVFGTTTAIADNTATNSFLRTDFTVHGDDFLWGGAANDTINAGTGDDRVQGSLGTDSTDGGKSYYAVQVLGEPQARVYLLNQWEATNPTKVSALSALTISSINRIGDAESGNATPVSTGLAEVYNDTLQFEQRHFSANTKFTVTLNNYSGTTASTLEFRNGGAGTVTVDDAGNGTTDGTTSFTNYENIRVVSGTGMAVAGMGQGDDTLDVAQLSSHSGGVAYDLTNRADAANPIGAGKVSYSMNAHASATRPVDTDFETLVIKVDGVENVITDNASVISGNDLLMIDETEAAKNNLFQAGEGNDRIQYLNDYGAGAAESAAQPTITIKVNSSTDTDTVISKGGRVGTLNTPTGGAVDTLVGVERIALDSFTAQSNREDDLIDVTSMTSGAVVDYTNGEVRTGIAPASGVQVVIENIVQMEKVLADGDDTVIVADADTMNNNARSDEGPDAKAPVDIQLPTFLDFDTFNMSGSSITSRKPFSAQTTGEIEDVINQNQFEFNLGTVGVDTVDYSNEQGRIVAVMNFTTTDPNKFVLVDGNGNMVFSDAESRIDKLVSVERIAASQGDSIIDLTNSGRDTNIVFSYNQPNQKVNFVEGTHKVTALDRQINTVRVSDAANQAALGNVDLIEYRDLGDSTATQAQALWNSVQGSDWREYVQVTQWEDEVAHTFNLRAGNNEVNYNERTNGIRLEIVSLDATIGASEHQYHLQVRHLTDIGTELNVDVDDTIYGYNQLNVVGKGGAIVPTASVTNPNTSNSLRIEASQGDQDFIDYFGLSSGVNAVIFLGQVESSGDSVVTASFLNTSNNTTTGSGLTLSGFERLWDGVGNDTYFITDLSGFAQKITLIDFNQTDGDLNGSFSPPSLDRDIIKLDDGAFETATIRAPVGQTITISNNLFMGSASNNVNDLQRIGVNEVNLMQPFGTGDSRGFDFQVLDIVEVDTINNITATGSGAGEGSTDELVLGDFARIAVAGQAVQGFDILSLSDKSAGTLFDFDITAGELQGSGGAKILGFDAFMDTLDLSRVAGRNVVITANSATAVTLRGSQGNDTITGSAGGDTLVGGLGNDTLDGGTAAERVEFNTAGNLGAVADLVIDFMNHGGAAIDFPVGGAVESPAGFSIFTEGVDFVAGAGNDAVGTAIATRLNGNLVATNLVFQAVAVEPAAVITGVTYDSTTDKLVFNFLSGVDVTALVTLNVDVADAVNGAPISSGTVSNGGSGGNDVFVFSDTAANNGVDTITNFVGGSAADDDLLDFTAFLGGPAGASVDGDFAAGVTVAAGGVAVVFNKTGGTLAATDIAVAAAVNKVTLANNGKAVVLVTADANGGADATNNPYNVYYVQDTDTGAGQTYTVTLVGTITSASELDSDDFLLNGDGIDGFV